MSAPTVIVVAPSLARLSVTPLIAPWMLLPALVTARPLIVAAASCPGWVVARPRPAAALPPRVIAPALPLSREIRTSLSLMTLAETPTSSVPLMRSAKVWRVSPASIATLAVVPPVVMSRLWPSTSAGLAAVAMVWAFARAVTTTL